MPRTWLPSVLEFLEELGFRFGLASNGVVIQCPEEWEALRLEIDRRGYRPLFKTALQGRETAKRYQCVGGPADGSRHGACPGVPLVWRVQPRKWVVYAVAKDGLAMFLGYETSQKKARERARKWLAGKTVTVNR